MGTNNDSNPAEVLVGCLIEGMEEAIDEHLQETTEDNNHNDLGVPEDWPYRSFEDGSDDPDNLSEALRMLQEHTDESQSSCSPRKCPKPITARTSGFTTTGLNPLKSEEIVPKPLAL